MADIIGILKVALDEVHSFESYSNASEQEVYYEKRGRNRNRKRSPCVFISFRTAEKIASAERIDAQQAAQVEVQPPDAAPIRVHSTGTHFFGSDRLCQLAQNTASSAFRSREPAKAT